MADITGAFCEVADISARTGISISGTTNPTQTEVEKFAVSRAAELQSTMIQAGFTVTPTDTFTGTKQTVLRERLREANAVGAAIDQWFAHFKGISPNKSEKIDRLIDRWSVLLVKLTETVSDTLGTFTPDEDDPEFVVDMDTQW